MLPHVKRDHTALSNYPLLIGQEFFELIQAVLLGNGTQGLCTLMTNHRVLFGFPEGLKKFRDAGSVLHLSKNIGYLVPKEGALALQTWN